jgi:hypothetical protein
MDIDAEHYQLQKESNTHTDTTLNSQGIAICVTTLAAKGSDGVDGTSLVHRLSEDWTVRQSAADCLPLAMTASFQPRASSNGTVFCKFVSLVGSLLVYSRLALTSHLHGAGCTVRKLVPRPFDASISLAGLNLCKPPDDFVLSPHLSLDDRH